MTPSDEQVAVQSGHTQVAASREIGVSAYDRAASLLLALFLIVGSATAVLLLIWFTKQVGPARYVAISIKTEHLAGRGDHEAGAARDATALAGDIGDAPGLDEEIEATTQPQVSASLEAVTSVVSTQSIALDQLYSGESIAGFLSIGRGGGLGGSGPGLGDRRPPGPPQEGVEGVKPSWERLELRFIAMSKAAYAKQLDKLGIEIGCIGGGEALVDYAFNLSKEKPDHRSGPGNKEKRVYFAHSEPASPLREWDRELAAAAGIPVEGRYALQFIPTALEKQLLKLEEERMGKRRIQEIDRTVFRIRESNGKCEVYVIEQTYRKAPRD
jgi:hypothetical protein